MTVTRRIAAISSTLCLLLSACGGSGGGATSQEPNLPTISAQPASQSILDGTSVALTVATTSSTPLTFQWRRDGSNISGATGNSISVPMTFAESGARFDVVVSNVAGNVTSSSAIVTVAPVPPTITTQPLSLTVETGSSVAFGVVAIGGTLPITYQWRRNGVDILNATASTYVLTAPSTSDSGASFQAAIINPSGILLSTAGVLTVTSVPQPPTITAQPQNQTVALGQMATFSVVASGSGSNAYQWSRNGVPIAAANNATFIIAATAAADNGAQFSVTITNSGLATISTTATLTINALASLTGLQLAAGRGHTVVGRADGTVVSWGSFAGIEGAGLSSAAGSGTPIPANFSVNDGGGVFSGASSISAGQFHTIVLRSDGSVWGWGVNSNGELGNGFTDPEYFPSKVVHAGGAAFAAVRQVSAGDKYSLSLKLDGTVWAWGRNDLGILGDGTTTTRLNPVAVSDSTGASFGGVVRVAAGHTHSLALKADGTVWAWGTNLNGQLGAGTPSGIAPGGVVASSLRPTRVEFPAGIPLSGIIAVAAGVYHSAAIRADGTAYTWGWDGRVVGFSGILPVKDSAGNVLSGFISVVAGDRYTMFLRSDGTVWETGRDTFGEYVFGSNEVLPMQPNAVVIKGADGFNFGGVDQIALTAKHTVVRRTDGSVWLWGNNRELQLGRASPQFLFRRNPILAPAF